MKIKDKIRNKLRHWLLDDELFQMEEAKKLYDKAEISCNHADIHLKDAITAYEASHKLVNDCQKMINSIVDVGTDVGFYSDDHSWAVVCIKGHPEYVKFIPLSHKSAREVLEFLKRFKYSDMVVDSPFSFRGMVDHCIMENPFEK